MKEENEEEKSIEVPSSSTLEMTFLVEAFTTSSPFNKCLVDLRDSLGYQLRTSMSELQKNMREELGIQVVYYVGRGGEHMIMNKIRMLGINHLSTENIIFSPDGNICISPSDISSMDGGSEYGIRDSEWKRYSSPEILTGEIREGNEETVVFTLGLILFSCLTASIPFNEFDSETAGSLILEGKRPSMEGRMEEWKEWIDFIVSCLNEEGRRRIRLSELIREMINRGGNLLRKEERMRKKFEREKEKKKEKKEKEKKAEESKRDPAVVF
jgi:serine/threonine protein kinase